MSPHSFVHFVTMKNILFLVLFFSFFHSVTASAQEAAAPDTMFWFMNRKDFTTYTTLAWSAGAVFMEFQWWWRDDYRYHKHKFHLASDGYFYDYSYGVDKLGHMFGSYLIFHLTYDFMKWAHYDERTA